MTMYFLRSFILKIKAGDSLATECHLTNESMFYKDQYYMPVGYTSIMRFPSESRYGRFRYITFLIYFFFGKI